MNKNKVLIIAEAGSNWRMGTERRDMKMAKTLIESASQAGADAIKFQTYRAETVYVSNAGKLSYLDEGNSPESISDIFKDLSMPYEMIPELADFSKSHSIEFMSTPFSIEDTKAIDPFVNRHKIASYEIGHSELISFIAQIGKPLILSTGGATIDEIKWAVNFFHSNGGKEISLMQNTAKYPAPFSTLNLRVIPTLKKIFDVPVGLSDHSRDPILAPVAAVALGATIIEKHFTLDNKLPGPDHSFAITSEELKKMVEAIRNCEDSLGSEDKFVQKDEEELRNFAQRGIQAKRNISKGESLEIGKNIDILRSGIQNKGLHPKFLNDIDGKKASRDIPVGDGIIHGDYE